MKLHWTIFGLLTAVFAASAQPVITNQPASQTNLVGSSATFNVAVSGTGPFTYQWQFNGTNLPNNLITTVAGTGTNGYSGDGGAATNARLYWPIGVSFDAAGSLYIADDLNQCIRKVDTNGIITTVAGNGIGAGSPFGIYSGDGLAATNAGLSEPQIAVFDTLGNLYIADEGNNRVRKVDTNGIITTMAGKGPSGIGGIYSGDGGAATNAGLNFPAGVALDTAGNLYIADQQNNRIRKVDAFGIITTIAGTNSAGFSGDGGPATNASLSHPQGICVDPAGNLYIADVVNNRIRKIDTNGIITTAAGTNTAGFSGDGGPAVLAKLASPYGVVVDGFGNLFIANEGFNRIRKVDTNGIITTVAGNNSVGGYSGDGGPATNASLNTPASVALDSAGNLYIADWRNNRVREVHFAGLPVYTLTGTTASSAGNYSVIVSSPYGSVTSSVVALTVVLPPEDFTAAVGTGGIGVQLQLSGTPDYPYVLLSATNLTPPVAWQPVVTNAADTNGNWSFTDTNTSAAAKFYRTAPQ